MRPCSCSGGGGSYSPSAANSANTSFSAWGEIFGDEVTATALIDRLVHHAEILSLKGDSYWLRDPRAGAAGGQQDGD